MEQIATKMKGMTLYMCNPEINKEFALKIGETAEEKE